MGTIRRILVGIKDYEARTTPALLKAGQLARALGAEIELFHGISTPLYVDGGFITGVELPRMETTVRARVTSGLERLVRKLRGEGARVSIAAEWDYPAHEAILRRAARIEADLIVVDQHEGRHRALSLLRLTDWELLRHSPIPVLLVRTPGTYHDPVILAAIDPGHAFAKPEKLDRRILAAGATFARALHGTQHIVHAYMAYPLLSDHQGLLTEEMVAALQVEARAKAQTMMDRELRALRVPKARRHLIGAQAADAITQTASRLHSSIVVMGAISRSGLKRLLIGNTAERALDRLGCDVLIIKPARFANNVRRTRRSAHVVPLAFLPLPV